MRASHTIVYNLLRGRLLRLMVTQPEESEYFLFWPVDGRDGGVAEGPGGGSGL